MAADGPIYNRRLSAITRPHGTIYLRRLQPEEDYYQEMVMQIKQAIDLLPRATMDSKADADIFDQLQGARQAAHFMAATLPRGGSITALSP